MKPEDFADADLDKGFFHNADYIILDAQYTIPESIAKENWGHSAFSYAIDFANHCNAQNVFLFHHEPMYDDKKIYSILDQAQWYLHNVLKSSMNVYIAREGLEVRI